MFFIKWLIFKALSIKKLKTFSKSLIISYYFQAVRTGERSTFCRFGSYDLLKRQLRSSGIEDRT